MLQFYEPAQSQGMSPVSATRPVFLTREAGVFRLSFGYSPELVEKAKTLVGARFDGETKTWTALVCTQNVDSLRTWFLEGVCDVAPDDLVGPSDQITTAPPAVLRSGTLRRPFLVVPNIRDDQLFTRLRSVSGAAWDSKAGAMSFPPTASAALAELVDRGVIVDSERILSPGDVTVSFDVRTGWFSVRGDERATGAFIKAFPKHDVVSIWRDRGLDVSFADSFTEEVYRAERVRDGEGLQPDGLQLDLFPYQRQAVAMVAERSGLGVFAEMGVGKTAIGIASGQELAVNRSDVTRTVIVVPGAVRTQWAREIVKFTGCDSDDIIVIDGPKKKRTALYEQAADRKWLVLNYDVLALDLDMLRPLVNGALLVADEAHRLKSPTAKRTKAMRTLAKQAAKRIALTGTPVENEPGEWFSVISGFVQPGCFGSPTEFLNRYSYPGRFGGYEGARNLNELRERSRVYYIRKTKAEVAAHLPPLRVQHKPLDVDSAYAAALKRAHRDARDEIRAEAVARAAKSNRANGVLDGDFFDEVEAGAEMTAVGMLKQLTLSPRLLWRSEAPSAQALCEAGLVPDVDGPKLDELRLQLAELQAEGRRVVVFSASRSMIELVAERCVEDGIRHVTFTGTTKSAERDAAVAAFTAAPTEEDPGPTVFLATDAGGEGLNLGAQCSLLVNLDIPWTPGRIAQRSARIHRIDGTAPRYLVLNLTLRGTIEEGILKLVERKADLQDVLFGEAGGRSRSTGRNGRNVFAEAFDQWVDDN